MEACSQPEVEGSSRHRLDRDTTPRLIDLWQHALRSSSGFIGRVEAFFIEKLVAQDKIRAHSALTALQMEVWRSRETMAPFGGDRHVIITGPTSSGKSTLGDLFLVRTAFLSRRSAVYVAPTRALTQAKWRELLALLSETPLRDKIVIATSEDVADDWRLMQGQFEIACMVYEKASALVSRFPAFLDRIGCVVIDELHLMMDPQRGARLELLLAKLADSRRRYDLACQLPGQMEPLRVVTLSTDPPTAALRSALSVIDGEKQWPPLEPLVYRSSERPACMHHCLVPRGPKDEPFDFVTITTVRENEDVRLTTERLQELNAKLAARPRCLGPTERDRDRLQRLMTTLLQKNPTGRRYLVFMGSKSAVESTAQALIARREPHGVSIPGLEKEIEMADDRELSDLILAGARVGCFIHHSDVEQALRAAIEIHTSQPIPAGGKSEVLIATTTLMYGVNLAITDVILPNVVFPTSDGDTILTTMLSHSAFHNMIGRAGRLGKMHDDAFVYIMEGNATNAFIDVVMRYYGVPSPPTSCLFGAADREHVMAALEAGESTRDFSDIFVRSVLDALRHVNNCSAVELASSLNDVLMLLGSTVLGQQLLFAERADEVLLLAQATKFVLDRFSRGPQPLVRHTSLDDRYSITPLGDALIDTGTRLQTVGPLFSLVAELEALWREETSSNEVPATLYLIALGVQRDVTSEYLDALIEMRHRRHWPARLVNENRADALQMFCYWLERAGVTSSRELATRFRAALERHASSYEREGGYPGATADAFIRFLNAVFAWIQGDSRTNVIRTFENSWKGRRLQFRAQRWRLLMEQLAWRVSFLARTLDVTDSKSQTGALDRNRALFTLAERVRLGCPIAGTPILRLRGLRVGRGVITRLLGDRVTPSRILALPADHGKLKRYNARWLHAPLLQHAVDALRGLAEVMMLGQPDQMRRISACKLWAMLANVAFQAAATEFDLRRGNGVGFDGILKQSLDMSGIAGTQESGISDSILGATGEEAIDPMYRLAVKCAPDQAGMTWLLRKLKSRRATRQDLFTVANRITIIGVEVRHDWSASILPGKWFEFSRLLDSCEAFQHLVFVILPWLPSMTMIPEHVMRALERRAGARGHTTTFITPAAFALIVSALARDWVSAECIVSNLTQSPSSHGFSFIGVLEVESTWMESSAMPSALRRKVVDHFEVRPTRIAPPKQDQLRKC